MLPDGALVVDKPAGMTSHDVVDRVRKIMGTRKVGHAGTLDPDATGVLVLGVGRGTRLLSFAQDGPKRYLATASFGTSTTTQDASGEVVETKPVEFDREDLEAAAARFLGDIEQVPPMVSAVKIGGEPLYKKARRGEEVERAPRRVTIHSLEVLDFSAAPPEARLEVVCSPGTYVRTLVHDLGQVLACGAHLKTLRRIASSGFTEADAVPLDELSPDHLLPVAKLVGDLPALEIDEDQRRLVSDGRPLPHAEPMAEGERVALVADGRLTAIYRKQDSALVAEKVLGT